MLYRVSGKFADGHTFSAQVDGDGPHDALNTFANFDDVKQYGKAISQVSVIRMEGKSRVRISDEPAKPRAPRKPSKPATTATPTKQATPQRR